MKNGLFSGFTTVATIGTYSIRACRFDCGLNPEYGIVIEGSDGRVSEMLSPTLKNLERTIRDLQYSVYMFTVEECQTIYEAIENAKLPTKEVSERAPIDALLQSIYEYACERSNPLNAYIKGDFVNIPVDEFSTFVAQRGYKALEAKKLFKRLDLLNPNDTCIAEPYSGSFVYSLNSSAKRIIFNDKNPMIYNYFMQMTNPISRGDFINKLACASLDKNTFDIALRHYKNSFWGVSDFDNGERKYNCCE